MKKIIAIVAIVSMLSSVCRGDCDFAKGITKNVDGTYNYTAECNRAAGQAVMDNKVKSKQVDDLNKAVTLKDLAITTADQRADNWMNTSLKLEETVQKVDSIKKENEWIFFGLGVLTTGIAAEAAAQIGRRH